MPEVSPVERYISLLKAAFGKLRLTAIVTNTTAESNELLEAAKDSIDTAVAMRICELGVKQWMQLDLPSALQLTKKG